MTSAASDILINRADDADHAAFLQSTTVPHTGNNSTDVITIYSRVSRIYPRQLFHRNMAGTLRLNVLVCIGSITMKF